MTSRFECWVEETMRARRKKDLEDLIAARSKRGEAVSEKPIPNDTLGRIERRDGWEEPDVLARELLQARRDLAEARGLLERCYCYSDGEVRGAPIHENPNPPFDERCCQCGEFTMNSHEALVHNVSCPWHPENKAQARAFLTRTAGGEQD